MGSSTPQNPAFSAFFVFAFAFVSAVAGFTPIVDLTDDSFDSFMTGKGLVVAKFYASWCPHSKELAPVFEEVAQSFENRASFVQIDAPENEELSKQFEIDGYPTILFIHGKEYEEYRGGRSVAHISAAVERKILPDVTFISSAESLKQFASSDKIVVLGHFISDNAQEYMDFARVAKGYKQEMRFGYLTDPKIASKFGIKSQPSMVMLKTFDEPRNEFDADFSLEKMEEFVTVYSIPLLDELTPDNYRYLIDSGIPLVVTFIDPSDSALKDSILSFLKPLTGEYRGRLTFAWVNEKQYASFGQSLGISQEDVPIGVIQTFDPSAHYIFNKDLEYTNENVQKWLLDYLGGHLDPDIRSQEIPEQQEDDPLTVVVADSFTEIVFDENVDVFIQFYAPWCGHCKALAPIWEELADTFANVESVVIAKIDATANDVIGVNIQGYPTMLFYPAGRKESPIEYEGERNLDDLVKFIEENADIEFTIPEEDDVQGDEEGDGQEDGDEDDYEEYENDGQETTNTQ